MRDRFSHAAQSCCDLKGLGLFLLSVVIVLTTLGSAQAWQTSRSGKQKSATIQIPQVQHIDQQIATVWQEYEIKPSKLATDGEWCRRVYLDILGRIPSVEELERYTKDKSDNKRERLVNKLLYDEEYTEEYARNWTTIWTNLLIGRTGGTERNSFTSRQGMQKYLRDTFARNKPYDRMVAELVSARGTTTPGSEKFNGATNFLAMKVNEENGAQATAATTRIFLGLQVQCTQCHNHPFNEWKQQKYWEMNAFFRQTRALRRFQSGTRNVSHVELIDQDFAGESRSDPENAELFYELRNGEVKVAYPTFIDGTKIDPSGFVADVNRRQELVRFMLKSEYLDKMIVNRIWAHFLGYGFTSPIDDLGPHNHPSHPELLSYLAQEFRSSSYNLKELMKWVTLSQAYSLSSRTNKSNAGDDPQLGETPKFSHFYIRQMRAEELYESLLVATKAHQTRGSYEEQERLKSRWLQQFTTAFGTDEGGEATTFNGTIPQVLMMFNGELVRQATSASKGSFLDELANSRGSRADKINHLFMAGLSRRPTKSEIDIANKLLVARNGNATEALQDLWWAILNSNEFIFNH